VRIGINTLFLIPGEVGGSQTYFCETLRAMIDQFPDDNFTLFTQRENDGFLKKTFGEEGCIRYEHLDFAAMNRFVRIIREQTELPWRVKKAAVDVLWSPGYTAPILCPVPQVLSILDIQYKRFPEDLSWLARLTTDLLLRLGVWRIKSILTISEFSKSEIVHFLHVDPDRITVTHLAASGVFSGTGQSPLPSSLPAAVIAGGYLLCVANTYPHKNVHTLVEAFGRIAATVPQSLVLVGKPRLGEEAVRQAIMAQPEATRKRIIRLEGLAFPELVALYQQACLFVFPSLYEGFGLPVLEALLAGVPVVASDIPTHREIGAAAVIYADGRDPVALSAVIQHALQTPEAHHQHDSIRQARSFTWQQTAQQTHATLTNATTHP
jgi:glycosyltransferase involved in cell wall biosynthesis